MYPSSGVAKAVTVSNSHPIGIVRSRSSGHFRDLAWAACERVERIAEDYIFASREHLEHWPSFSFEELA